MEKVYPPNKFPCSENVPLKDMFLKYSELADLNLDPDFEKITSSEQDEILLNMLGIDKKASRKQLLENISVDSLNTKGESSSEGAGSSSAQHSRTKETWEGIPEEALQLETVKLRKKYKNDFQEMYMRHKYRQEPSECDATEKSKHTNNLQQGKEFVVAIRIYHPFQFNYAHFNSCQNLKFSHEIAVLGSNTLANLRDKIICQSDIGIAVEVEDPSADLCVANAKEAYPSGFIFIDNVFYNDLRHPNSFDYSEVIRQWAAEKGIGPLQYGSMENTKIEDLSPRFGYPYVYQHQGRCEHILVFSDAWLLTSKDSLDSKDYPMYTGIHRLYSKHCTICYAQGAKWICVDSDRLPHNKTFLCQECFVSYNYIDGKKIGNFKAYPYFDRSLLM